VVKKRFVGDVWMMGLACFSFMYLLERIVSIVDKECSNNQVQRSEMDYMIDPAILLTIASVNEGVLVEEGSDEKKNDGGGRRRKDLFGCALQKGNAGRGSSSC